MPVWLDIYDPTYTTRIGDGPVFIQSASFTRALNECSSGSANLDGLDLRALTLITPRSVAEVWFQEEGFQKRLLGAFVVESDGHRYQASGTPRDINGNSTMVATINEILLPGANYVDTVSNIVDDLTSKVGWTADVDSAIASDSLSLQYAGGENILRALQVAAETKGVHLRESLTTAKEIEFGAFGQDAGVWAEYIEGDGGDVSRVRDNVFVIQDIDLVYESHEIFNWALGFYGGTGDAAGSLADSTRSFVDSITANGRTHYIIADNVSIATYGKIARRVDAKRIIPTGTSTTARQAAADAAADAIKAKLDRNKDPQEVLNITLLNVRKPVNVGDKIHIRFKGVMNKNGIPYAYRDIDADYWIMQATESVSDNGIVLSLQVSNVDKPLTDTPSIIVGMVDKLNAAEVDIQPYPGVDNAGPYRGLLNDTNDLTFDELEIAGDVLNVRAVELRLKFRTPVNTQKLPNVLVLSDVDVNVNNPHSHVVTNYAYDFGIFPRGGIVYNITITVNGTQLPDLVLDSLNLPPGIDGFSTAYDYSVDITDEILAKAGGFQGAHTVVLSCTSGFAEVTAEFRIQADFTKVRTS